MTIYFQVTFYNLHWSRIWHSASNFERSENTWAEVVPHEYSLLIFDKGAKIIQ